MPEGDWQLLVTVAVLLLVIYGLVRFVVWAARK
jgi:hypothetical protein